MYNVCSNIYILYRFFFSELCAHQIKYNLYSMGYVFFLYQKKKFRLLFEYKTQIEKLCII